MFQPHRRGHELLLRAVMQVTLDRPAGAISGLRDPSPGRLQLPRPQPIRIVAERHDRAAPAGQIHRRRRVRHGHPGAVLAHEPVLLLVERLASGTRAQQRAVLLRKR
jgi:hypothetical protein